MIDEQQIQLSADNFWVIETLLFHVAKVSDSNNNMYRDHDNGKYPLEFSSYHKNFWW